jgi:hypothetical protein
MNTKEIQQQHRARVERVFQLRQAGHSFPFIAAALNIALATAYKFHDEAERAHAAEGRAFATLTALGLTPDAVRRLTHQTP